MQPRSRVEDLPTGALYTPEKTDAVEFLRLWKRGNPEEYDVVTSHQEEERRARMAAAPEMTASTEQSSVEESSIDEGVGKFETEQANKKK